MNLLFRIILITLQLFAEFTMFARFTSFPKIPFFNILFAFFKIKLERWMQNKHFFLSGHCTTHLPLKHFPKFVRLRPMKKKA
jgi:hypothetical protein